MLKNLYIRNFVLIDGLNLDFENGFSSFTGETGAGKSIMIDAISLLAAERASASYVMKGKEKAVIEGTFDLSKNSHACSVLEESGFDISDEMTFTREIFATGKSTARIDHRIVQLSLLKEVLRYEIDIHGQRDNAYLLQTANHERLLDAFINDYRLLEETKEKYRSFDRLKKERDSALSETYNEDDLEFLNYQIREIRSAQLEQGEDEELAQKEKQYRSLRSSIEKLQSALSLYDEQISDAFYELTHILSALSADDTYENISQSASDSWYMLNDAIEQLRDIRDGSEMSEEEINAVEERLYLIQKLKRKYGRTISDILAKAEEYEAQVEIITHRQEYLDQKNAEVNKAYEIYMKSAKRLSELRRKHCVTLDEKIQNNLRELMLENARFKTSITSKEPGLSGIDHVEFLIAMNKGEDLKPLSSTASGGELSRLMLGLKEIFTRLQGIQVVVFDEIDTGVSGPVATAIGKKMKSLSSCCQVFAVTHLAQVAACADYHYLVAKSDDDQRTTTMVRQLNEAESAEQLALIAYGEVNETSLTAAKDLMARNRS